MGVNGVSQGVPGLPPLRRPEEPRAADSGFGELLRRAVADANRAQIEAEEQGRKLAAGETDIVDAMVALSRADVTLRFVVALRDRALEAWREISRLQV